MRGLIMKLELISSQLTPEGRMTPNVRIRLKHFGLSKDDVKEYEEVVYYPGAADTSGPGYILKSKDDLFQYELDAINIQAHT